MSLRKSPTLTPARLEANRRSSRKSTGPRTARGKSQSRMNSLRTGFRSRFLHDLYLTLFYAPPYAVDRVARAVLTRSQAAAWVVRTESTRADGAIMPCGSGNRAL